MYDKNSQTVGIDKTFFNVIKSIYDKLTANITLNVENLKAFPLKSETRQVYPLLPLLFTIVLEGLHQLDKKKK